MTAAVTSTHEPGDGAMARRVKASLPVAASRLLVLGLVALAWQLAANAGVIDTRTLSEPSAVAVRLWDTLTGGPVFGPTIATHLVATAQATAVGYLIGALAGVLLGYFLGRSALVAAVFQPYITALTAVPKIALVPLLVLIFGLGQPAEIASVALMVFIALVFNTFSGVLNIDEEYVRHARLMGAGRRTVALRVIIPAAMPSIAVGLRTGVPFAMIGSITAEFVASTEGLGWAIQQATATYDPTSLFAIILYLIALTFGFSQLVALLQRRVLRWQR